MGVATMGLVLRGTKIMLDVFALLVMLLLAGVGIWLVVLLGNLPGKLARAAGHPQAKAINVLSWVGLLTLGIGWFAALVWANTTPGMPSGELEQRVQALEDKLATREASE
jgi:hypothetical protein